MGIGSGVLSAAIGNTYPILGEATNLGLSITDSIGNQDIAAVMNNAAIATKSITTVIGNTAIKIGSDYSLSSSIGGNQLLGASNSGVGATMTAAIGNTKLLGDNSKAISLSAAIGNNEIRGSSISATLGDTELYNGATDTFLSDSRAIAQTQRDIGNIGGNYNTKGYSGSGLLFSLATPSPAAIAKDIGKIIGNSFNSNPSSNGAYVIFNIVASKDPQLSQSDLETDMTNSLTYGNSYPTDASNVGFKVSDCMNALISTYSNTLSSITTTMVGNCIYNTATTWTTGTGPVHISSSTNLDDLITDVGNSGPTLTKAIGMNSISSLGDGSITGAIDALSISPPTYQWSNYGATPNYYFTPVGHKIYSCTSATSNSGLVVADLSWVTSGAPSTGDYLTAQINCNLWAASAFNNDFASDYVNGDTYKDNKDNMYYAIDSTSNTCTSVKDDSLTMSGSAFTVCMWAVYH